MSLLKIDHFILMVATSVVAWALIGVPVVQAQAEQERDGLAVLAELQVTDRSELARAAWETDVPPGQPAVLLLQDNGGDGEWIASLQAEGPVLTGLLEEGDRIRGEVDLMRRIRLASGTDRLDTDPNIVVERSIVATLHAETGSLHLAGDIVRITTEADETTRVFLPVVMGPDLEQLGRAIAAFSDIRALRGSREVSPVPHKEVSHVPAAKHEPGCPTGPTTGCLGCSERYDDDMSACDWRYLGCASLASGFTILCLATCPTTGPLAGGCAAGCVAVGLGAEADCYLDLRTCQERARRDREVCLQLC